MSTSSGVDAARSCGGCSLCCIVLRVDELEKLGGTACSKLAETGGCSIHADRPGICRAYQCHWLRGGLREEDRPDRLGALLDLVPKAGSVELAIREATPGAFDRSSRLQEIAAEYRRSMPVRITDVGDVMDPDRLFRVLLPDGEDQHVAGDAIRVYRDGVLLEERRMPWLERRLRRLGNFLRRRKVQRFGRGKFADAPDRGVPSKADDASG